MTHDKEHFKELKPTRVANVRIGHGGHIPVKGMGTIAVETKKYCIQQKKMSLSYGIRDSGTIIIKGLSRCKS
ncbi:hypothetical protein KY285_001035 [Solanum tuberosum]|nr:hypothetical protein KY285_001035 [Solanum tuberosum]